MRILLLIFLPFFSFAQKGYLIKYEYFIRNYDSLVIYQFIEHEREVSMSYEATLLKKIGLENPIYYHDKLSGETLEIASKYSYHEKEQLPILDTINFEAGKEKMILGYNCRKQITPYFNGDSIHWWTTAALGVSDHDFWNGLSGVPLQHEYPLGNSTIICKAQSITPLEKPITKPEIGKRTSAYSYSETLNLEAVKNKFEENKKRIASAFFNQKLKTATGEVINTADLKGKFVVLNIKNSQLIGGHEKNRVQGILSKKFKEREDVVFLSVWGIPKRILNQYIKNGWNSNGYQLIPSASKIATKLGVKKNHEMDLVIDKEGNVNVFFEQKKTLCREISNFIEGEGKYSLKEYDPWK